MEQIVIGPGEEKLGKAFEMILAQQKLLLVLSQRIEVDSIVISLLLDRINDPRAALQGWKSKMASYYPERAIGLLGDEQMDRSAEELKHRIDLWTRALEARAQADQSE